MKSPFSLTGVLSVALVLSLSANSWCDTPLQFVTEGSQVLSLLTSNGPIVEQTQFQAAFPGVFLGAPVYPSFDIVEQLLTPSPTVTVDVFLNGAGLRRHFGGFEIAEYRIDGLGRNC